MILAPSIFTRHKYLAPALLLAALIVGGEAGLPHHKAAKADADKLAAKAEERAILATLTYRPTPQLFAWQERAIEMRNLERDRKGSK